VGTGPERAEMFRWAMGPVLLYEVITASRRWTAYALRVLLVAAMLVALWIAWLGVECRRDLNPASIRQYLSELGERLYYGVAGIEMTLALVVAPAATAGAVCVDRARGWLAHLFVTEVSDCEIVTGKLVARLAWTFALVLTGVPVLAICTLLGGVVPEAILVLTSATLAVCLLGCSLALALSVRAAKTHEVLMVVFTIWIIWLLSYPVSLGSADAGLLPRPPDWFAKLNPYVLTYSVYVKPGYVDVMDVIVFAATALAFSILATTLAVYWLRQDLRPLGERSMHVESLRRFVKAQLFSWWPSPSLDGNPVLWREWHRNRPSRMAGFVSRFFFVAAVLGTVIGIADAVEHGVGVSRDILVGVSVFGVTIGLLLLSATASTTLAEERVSGGLDVLLSTPLASRQIVLGKWWASYRRTLPLLVLPALAGLFAGAATVDGPPCLPFPSQFRYVPITTWDRVLAGALPSAFLLVHAAAITGTGLAVATWVRRTGLAVALSVSAFVLVSFAWPFAAELGVSPILQRWSNPRQPEDYDRVFAITQGLIALSPIGGQTAPLDNLRNYWSGTRTLRWWLLLGDVVVVAAYAAFSLGLVLLTFNRCVGRMDQTTSGSPALSARRSVPVERIAVTADSA
jgi:ABC-type transport system involved in multi-copper enzyme maturation permease subunit